MINPPTAVTAGPIAGDNPIKPRITCAVLELDCVAQLNVLLIISSKELVTPLLAARDFFVKSSQLPPTCSIFEPIFCCISFAWLESVCVARCVVPAALSIELENASHEVVTLPDLSLTASSNGAMAFIPEAPNIVFNAAVFCASPILSVLEATSCKICGNGFIFPLESVKDNPNSFISFLACALGANI